MWLKTANILLLVSLSLHCALRSCEVQAALTKKDIVVDKDSQGRTYATLRRDFVSKNCRGDTNGREFETPGRAQEPKQVEALKRLLSKLYPEVDRVFQRSLSREVNERDNVWFMKATRTKPTGRYAFVHLECSGAVTAVHKSLLTSNDHFYPEERRC